MIFLACLIAGISVVAFVILWFCMVWRELCAKKKAVDAARCQLAAGKQAYLRAREGPNEQQAREIMERSQSIYNQSVQLYRETINKPWNMVPAFFLGFRLENETNQTG